jgi:hypothetical protein
LSFLAFFIAGCDEVYLIVGGGVRYRFLLMGARLGLTQRAFRTSSRRGLGLRFLVFAMSLD